MAKSERVRGRRAGQLTSPEGVELEDAGVTDDDEPRLRAGDGDVEALRVREKAEVRASVERQEVEVGAHGRDDDDPTSEVGD